MTKCTNFACTLRCERRVPPVCLACRVATIFYHTSHCLQTVSARPGHTASHSVDLERFLPSRTESTKMRRKNKHAAKQEEPGQSFYESLPKSASTKKKHGVLRKAVKPLQYARNRIICCLRLTWWQCLLPLLGFGLFAYGVRILPYAEHQPLHSRLTAWVYL